MKQIMDSFKTGLEKALSEQANIFYKVIEAQEAEIKRLRSALENILYHENERIEYELKKQVMDIIQEDKLEIFVPPKPKWKMCLGYKVEPIFMVPTAPKTFYRFMQRVFLGIVWEKI